MKERARKQYSGLPRKFSPVGGVDGVSVDDVIQALQRHKSGGDENDEEEEERDIEADGAEYDCGGPDKCWDARCALCPVPRRCYDSQGTCHRVCERKGRIVHLDG